MSNYPPGVTEDMIPGNRPQDAVWEKLFDQLPPECPDCTQPTAGTDAHGLAEHVRLIEDECGVEIRCEFEGLDLEPCEATLAEVGCGPGCPECDPRDHWEDRS